MSGANETICSRIQCKDKGNGEDKDRVRKIMPLTNVSPGREVTLIDIQGGRGLRSKLYSMGLIPGAKLKIVGNGGGPIMIAINDTRLALGFGMARKIMVE